MAGALCKKCGSRLDKTLLLAGMDKHPTCQPRPASEILAEEITSDLKDIVRWTDNNAARSLQASIGPSELGEPCERKISYRLAGVTEVNEWTDPWPAIVGTAVHAWLERAIGKFQSVHHMDRWVTESTVRVDALVTGHVDLYDRQTGTVIDFKTMSPTKMKDFLRKGPSEQHIDQVNLYALGLSNAGQAVNYVSLVAVPRSGWLSEFKTWVGPYEPSRAARALSRMYTIADELIAQGDVIDFSTIPAEPGRGCSFCPWYVGGDRVPSAAGCPGDSAARVEKYSAGLAG